MIEKITTIEELAGLRAEWNALADRHEQPLLRHEWFLAAAEAFAGTESLCVLASREAGRLRAIAPMSISVDSNGKRMEILGSPVLQEPSGLLYEDEAALEELLKQLPRYGYPINLRRVGTDSAEARLVSGCAPLVSVRDGGKSPVLPIETDFAAFEKSMSSRRRSDLRRALRRAEKLGPVTFENRLATPADVGGLLEEVLRVEQANYKGETGSAVLANPALHRFFQLYAAAAAEASMLRLFFMRVEGRAVGALITTEFANRLWTLKLGYDHEFNRCSPGILVMHEAIRHAFDHGCCGFEFMGFDSTWMHIWTKQARDFVSPAIYPFSPRGLGGLGRDASRFLMRKLASARQGESEQ